MTDDLRTRIAAVLVKHAAAEYSWGVDGCECGFGAEDNSAQAAHQADVLIRELGMTIETDGPPIVPPCHRYVTEWTTDD